ncbi:MAG TPA: cation:proton antiporter regulatory subunit [Acidimicrobiia bacterium]|nr:cation:proton antiporter regulatory subunit [Acidimicrobiia bacterium]
MPEIQETPLPGVGTRLDFTTEDGNRLGVVHHRTGRKEVFLCEPEDPDSVALSFNLSDDDSHTLAEVLGGSSVVENLSRLQQQIEGLAIDWLAVAPESPYSGRTIGDARIRTRTGVSVVAVIRHEEAFPAPGPEFVIEPSDTMVVVGTADGINQVGDILMSG